MKELYTTINGIKVFRYRLIDNHTQWKLPVKICAICQKEIKDGDKVSHIMNNNKLFPNIFIHDSHLIIDKYDPKATILYLISQYNKYLSHANERKIWE